MRIFIVAMPGDGNLGDDLISTLLVGHVVSRWPHADVGVLRGAQSNLFGYTGLDNLRLFDKPRRTQPLLSRKRWRAIKEFLRATDLILIGGGGLFQDSHARFTIHNWVRYALLRDALHCDAWIVGAGFGPLNSRFSHWYLRHVLDRFSIIQVRDSESASIIQDKGYRAEVGTDVVEGSPINRTAFTVRSRPADRVLGCSIRPWPGLNFEHLADLISTYSTNRGLTVRLFVFECHELDDTEYRCAIRIMEEIEKRGVTAQVFCYGRNGIDEFAAAFSTCRYAIASRYHANILWQLLDIPVLPISYAPKVRRLYEKFGRPSWSIGELPKDIRSTNFVRISLNSVYELPKSTIGRMPTHSTTWFRILRATISCADFFESGWSVFSRILHKNIGLDAELTRDRRSK